MSEIASAPAILRRASAPIEAILQPIATATPAIGSVIPAISPFFAADYDRVLAESVTYRPQTVTHSTAPSEHLGGSMRICVLQPHALRTIVLLLSST